MRAKQVETQQTPRAFHCSWVSQDSKYRTAIFKVFTRSLIAIRDISILLLGVSIIVHTYRWDKVKS